MIISFPGADFLTRCRFLSINLMMLDYDLIHVVDFLLDETL